MSEVLEFHVDGRPKHWVEFHYVSGSCESKAEAVEKAKIAAHHLLARLDEEEIQVSAERTRDLSKLLDKYEVTSHHHHTMRSNNG